MTSQLHTVQVQQWIQGMRAGDRAAQDAFFRAIDERLQHLAHKMLRQFPSVKRWADTCDVVQNAALRLMRALREVEPASTRDLFALSAELIRRELLDLARHFSSSKGMGNQKSIPPTKDSAAGPPEPAAPTEGDELEQWCAFHDQVAALPVEERELVGLVFYHGWTQQEAAELFQVTERTIRRRWQSAMLKLHAVLKLEDESH